MLLKRKVLIVYRLARKVGFRPHRNCPLDVEGKRRYSGILFQSHDRKAAFAEFRGCPQHGQVTASC